MHSYNTIILLSQKVQHLYIGVALVVSVLGLIRSCTNVTLYNVIHFQFTGHKWRIYV